MRLHNAGFGDEDPQYDAMIDGWKLFMSNLQLHLEHFAGQTATSPPWCLELPPRTFRVRLT